LESAHLLITNLLNEYKLSQFAENKRTPIIMSDTGCPKDETPSIAVIGLSGRFPGQATNPDKLWEMCAAGKDAWSPLPCNRFNSEAFYHPDSGRNGSVSRVGPVNYGEIAHTSRIMFVVASF
jgi:hypothetical protein